MTNTNTPESGNIDKSTDAAETLENKVSSLRNAAFKDRLIGSVSVGFSGLTGIILINTFDNAPTLPAALTVGTFFISTCFGAYALSESSAETSQANSIEAAMITNQGTEIQISPLAPNTLES